jgi:hypothetical protein
LEFKISDFAGINEIKSLKFCIPKLSLAVLWIIKGLRGKKFGIDRAIFFFGSV